MTAVLVVLGFGALVWLVLVLTAPVIDEPHAACSSVTSGVADTADGGLKAPSSAVFGVPGAMPAARQTGHPTLSGSTASSEADKRRRVL